MQELQQRVTDRLKDYTPIPFFLKNPSGGPEFSTNNVDTQGIYIYLFLKVI